MKHLLISFVVLLVVLMVLVVTACAADESAERSAHIPVAGANSVRIIAEAGDLDITGTSGVTEVSVTGTAWARSTEDLEELQIVTNSTGTEIVIELKTPPWNSRLDVAVEVPDSFQVVIDDTSGSILVTGVAGVQLTDASGRIEVSRVSGAVTVNDDDSGDIDVRSVGQDVDIVDDGAGSIVVSDVKGNCQIGSDGSGDIEVRNVERDVDVADDGSGSITVSEVTGSFRVGNDGSGDITARGIGGDFVVEDGGSGDISYSEIGGSVDVPD